MDNNEEENLIFKNSIINDIKKPFTFDGISKDNDLQSFAKTLDTVIDKELQRITKGEKEKSIIVSVYADWGLGKTTFIDMWGQSLVNKEIVALKFDAWKHDYSEEPMLPFITEIVSQVDAHYKKMAKEETWTKALLQVGKDFVSAASLNLGVVNISGEKLLKAIESTFQTKKSNVEKFREQLKATIGKNKEKKMYVFIDELDRCNPIFALKLLEIAKHLFSVQGICFVLSMNRNSLKSTIEKNYGLEDLAASEYLERFFDFQFQLPEPDRAKYAAIEIGTTIDDYFADKKCIYVDDIRGLTKKIFISCCSNKPFGFHLRDIEKQAREINLFLSVCTNERVPVQFMPIAIYLSCLKRKYPGQYAEKDNYDNDFIPAFADMKDRKFFTQLLEIFFASKYKGRLEGTVNGMATHLNSRAQEDAQVKSWLYKPLWDLFFGDRKEVVFPVNGSYSEPGSVVYNITDSFQEGKYLNDLYKMIDFIHRTEVEDD